MLFEVGEEEEEEEKGLVEVDKERPRVVSEEEGRRKWKGLKWAVSKVQGRKRRELQ